MLEYKFVDYRLCIRGLVTQPLELSLDELQSMEQTSHTVKHVCIQGWTAIGQWAGVPMKDIFERIKPLPQATRVFFHSFQTDEKGRNYYTSLDLKECLHPRTILAYEMNHRALPVEHGAPLRLRVETKLGFTMCKWIKSIEVVASIKDVGLGHGGYREDYQFYGTEAYI